MDAAITINKKCLEMFRPAFEIEVTKSPYKSSDLEPLLNWPLRKCGDHILLLITDIFNRSIGESKMSLCLKRTTLTPLPKSYGLDKEDMKNCGPISNLPFISKRIEKVVARDIETYLEQSDLHGVYPKQLSTETTTFKVHSDISEALVE